MRIPCPQSRGHGVHSPFVYNLITRVIREPASYYRLLELRHLHRSLCADPVLFPFPASCDAHLLFRLTIHFHPHRTLLLGSALALPSLFLAAPTPDLRLLALEHAQSDADLTRSFCLRTHLHSVSVQHGFHRLPDLLPSFAPIDFLYLNPAFPLHTTSDPLHLFNLTLPFLHPSTCILCDGLRRSPMRHFWNQLRLHPAVTVSLDLASLGIVFINPALHRKNYRLYR